MSPPIDVAVNLLWLVPGVVGGSETYAVRLLQHWALDPPRDIRLSLVVNGRFRPVHGDLVEAFPTHIAPVSGGGKAARVLIETTWLGARLHRSKPNLVHHLGGIAPLWRPIPTIVTVHDLQPLALPAHFHPVKRRFITTVLPPSVRTARRVTTLSSFVKDDVCARLGVDPNRVDVIPPGLDPLPAVTRSTPSALAAERDRVRRAYDLGDRPFFLYPAITYRHKNHAMLIEAFARLARTRPEPLLVLAGGFGDTESAVRDAIDRRGIADRVRRTGRVPEPDLDALYRGAAALVFPSVYEGFGLPTLEAMARGCPVLAADATALPAVVGDGAVLIAPSDPDEWCAAMVSVLDDPGYRRRLVESGHARAAMFDWGRSVEQLAEVYRRAAKP